MEIVNNLKSTIQDIESFFLENGIAFSPVRQKGNKYFLDFIIEVISYTSKTDLANSFHFELELKVLKNLTLFEIRTKEGSKIPFHPHFKISENFLFLTKQAKWIGYIGEENIVSFTKRMILSLQFNKGYIIIEPDKIGNKDAKHWYLEENYKNGDKFPTDVFLNNPIKVTSASKPIKTETSKNSTLKIQSKKFQVGNKISEKKKFTINEQINYNLESKSLSEFNFDIDNNLNSIINTDSKTKLFILESAKKKIWKHIKWSNLQTPSNKNEQGGVLLGQVYYDSKNKIQFGVVEQVVYGDSARGNSVYLEMNHETWAQMLNDADRIIDESQGSNIQVIGWYHTHPNNLDVFMSGTDINTQQRFFNQSWHYAIVLNPHREIWIAFVGIEAKECQGFFVKDKIGDSKKEIENQEEYIRTIPKKKDLAIIILIMALVSTIGFIFLQNKKSSTNKETLQDELLSKKLISKKLILYSPIGDTIDITDNNRFDLQKNNLEFNNQLFVKKKSVIYNSDSTKVSFQTQLYIKDSISTYSKFGILRDTLSILSIEIHKDSTEWVGFNFKGLIRDKYDPLH